MSLLPFEPADLRSLASQLPAYEFQCLIAEGRMGSVYRARQISLDREVALKILPRELGEDPHFREAFEAEAKAMACLSHTNLIRIFDFGTVDGLLYVAMEYVPGKSLFHSAHGKTIDPVQAVEIVIAACRGLAHAHSNGIIHRDIKPANILLTPKCEPKIGDFGLARCPRANAEGPAAGGLEYRAPEIIDHPEAGDEKSDVFAMGVILRELLTGISAGSQEFANAVVSDPALETLCRKATHADRCMRTPDADSFADQLTRWMAPRATQVLPSNRVPMGPRPVSQPPSPARVAQRRPSARRTLLKNCAAVLLFAGSSYLSWSVYQFKQRTQDRLQQAQNSGAAIESLEAAAGNGVTLTRGEGKQAGTVTVQISYLDLLVDQGTSLAGKISK